MRLLRAALLTVGWALLPTFSVGGQVNACAEDPRAGITACLESLTDRYGHNVLGPFGEWSVLSVHMSSPSAAQILVVSGQIQLPQDRVFEDVEPRFGDLTGDGWPELVTVISTTSGAAALSVFAVPSTSPEPEAEAVPPLELIAATPPIGQRNRWLAPAGIADLDGDGQNDIAYVDRPHLAGILRVWTLQNGQLAEIASISGFSNHLIGQDFITGGVRDCGDGPELVLPNFNWMGLMAVRMTGGALDARQIGRDTGPAAVEDALACAS